MAKQMPKRSLEKVGLGVTGACVALVTLVVVALIFMVAQRGLSTFFKDGVDVLGFFTGTDWNLAVENPETGLPYTGALPLIVTSFAVTILSTVIAVPIAIGAAIYVVEISPVFGQKYFQPLIELFGGYPLGCLRSHRFPRHRWCGPRDFQCRPGFGYFAGLHRACPYDSPHGHDPFDRRVARGAR